MNCKTFNEFLFKSVPIAKAMGITIDGITDDHVILRAPLSPNINHKHTAFGGSLHSVATLACWCYLHLQLKQREEAPIVIVSSQISYLRPVEGDFYAICKAPHHDEWEKFLKAFSKKGKGRLELKAEIIQNDQVCVAYSGVFAAIKKLS